ncbi:MAG: hypothetical protein CVU64_08805 [Deltaproteobacteria bacterium HGW-Deltaproteobacteria-21]|jgi:uncharacterized protein YjgD (DUF1641 family)|nr:MAG: hypothetical protein CVU64_08805 [Deltaproteobacteria bacterium HGW-Deltaproteobacteria-21]
MNNEELILQRLDRLEAALVPLSEFSRSLSELKEDLTPLVNRGFKFLIEELQDVESAFQLEDLFQLIKRTLRNVKNLNYTLEQLETVVDLVKTVEPLLKSTVPQMIKRLDELEQNGVFRTYSAMLSVRAKIAKQYTPEDFELMGDVFTSLLGVMKKLAKPEVLIMLERMAEIPSCLDLDACESIGPVGLIRASYSDDVKQGLGVVIGLTKALGKLKGGEAG